MRFTTVETVAKEHDGGEFWDCSECQTHASYAPRDLQDNHNGHVHKRIVDLRKLRRSVQQSKLARQPPPRRFQQRLHQSRSMNMAQGEFVNHYAALGLPVAAVRGDIFEAYHKRRELLREATPHDGDESATEATKKLRQLLPPASEALQAVLSSPSKPLLKQTDNLVGSTGGGLKTNTDEPTAKLGEGVIPKVASRPSPLFPCLEALQTSLSKWSRPRPAPGGDNDEVTTQAGTHQQITPDEDIWHPSNAETTIERNKLTDAYSILSHPVKKKVYDYINLVHLQAYEGQRIVQDVHGKTQQKVALEKAVSWRSSLLHGHKYGSEHDEGEFGRVKHLKGTTKQDRHLVPSSMMCGEVIAGFADGMEM